MANTIPVIDMKEVEGQSKKLIAACEEWGIFRVTNHGIPVPLLSEMKSVTRALLDLPVEIKRLAPDREGFGKGYSAPVENISLLEGMDVYDMASPGALEAFCSSLNVTPQQRETMMKYSEAMHKLAMNIGNRIGEGLGLEGELFKGWFCRFRLNIYRFTPETVGLTGAPIHTDISFLTFLQEDDKVNGLEIVDNKSGKLIPVDPVSGTLVVNVGDIAKAWSNGRFNNVKHRVQCNEGNTRVSTVLFMLGPKDTKVEAPSQLVDSKHPRLYLPFSIEEYTQLRLSTRLPAGEALEKLRTTS